MAKKPKKIKVKDSNDIIENLAFNLWSHKQLDVAPAIKGTFDQWVTWNKRDKDLWRLMAKTNLEVMFMRISEKEWDKIIAVINENKDLDSYWNELFTSIKETIYEKEK